MLLADTINLFILYKTGENLSTGTLDWYRIVLTHFTAWLNDNRPLAQLSATTITLYLAHERNRGLAPATVNGRYRAIQAWLNWCEESDEVLATTPTWTSPLGHGQRKKVKPPRVPDKTIRHIQPHEFTQLIAAIDLATWIDYRDWCIIHLLYWTGIRRAELCQLTIDDINFNQATVQIQRGKGDKTRVVPMIEEILDGLRMYITTRPAWHSRDLWLAYDTYRRHVRGPLTRSGLRQMLIRRCRRAHLRPLNPHLFRHTIATELLNAGADMSSVRDILGHSKTSTTESIYAKFRIAGIQRAYNQAVQHMRSGS